MSLNSQYITALDLNQYFVKKTTGQPLAGGIISFYEDSSRTTPKAVYELTGSPPNYTYTALPNSLTLSAAGTIVDSTGNQVALYYYPYDENGDVQLYYIVVTDASGAPQFTREAWPNITDENSPSSEINNVVVNQLSNPQFVDVLFDASETWTISFSASTTYTIAPDWFLDIGANGAGAVQVTRTAIAGISQYPANAPYKMTFTPGGNINGLTLRQRLYNNPNIWAPATGGDGGCVAFNVTLDNGSGLSATYQPSNGTSTTLFNETNTTGVPFEFSTVTQLPPADSLNTANTGYVDIKLNLNTSTPTTLTNVQIVGVDSPQVTGVKFNQAPVNRQVDQLFNYYKAPLEQKPLKSYLVGWDFPLNPAQPLGPTVSAFATGANTSNYVWDQTICFQSANSGVSFSRNADSGALVVTGAATGQFALIQYIDMPTAYQVLNQEVSVNISAATNVVDGVQGTVQLYYCTDASLPDITANRSIVATLSAEGAVATDNGTWLPVTRKLPSAKFTIGTSATTEFNDYAFSGWDMAGASAINSATYVALVVGFEPIANANTLTFNSISLVPGSIATRPAPQSLDEVLFECQRYYESSYPENSLPGASTNDGCLIAPQSYSKNGTTWSGCATSFGISYKAPKRASTPVVTLYAGINGGAGNVLGFINKPSTNSITGPVNVSVSTYWSAYSQGSKGILYQPITNQNMGLSYSDSTTEFIASSWIVFQYVSDCRLGVV